MSIVRRFRERVLRLVRLHHQVEDLANRVSDNARRTSAVAARLEVLMREHRLIARQLTLPPAPLWMDGPPPATDAR